jgi:hypothetical protein
MTSFKEQIQYLGHVISEEGVAVDPEKIKEIMDWPIPRNVSEVRSFMGLVGYYKGSLKVFQGLAIQSLSYKEKE